jgi:histidyl-tRNA synthetase
MVLTAEAEDFFGAVKAGLDAAGVDYEIAPHLVRGLDYYRHTAFEFVTDQLGAQGTVIAGGRYDGLIEQLGGPHTPAVGWAAGIERLAMLIEAPTSEGLDAAIVVEDDRAIAVGWRVATRLREAGLSTEIIASGSPRKRYDRAVKKGASEIIILSVEGDAVSHRIKSNGTPRAEPTLAGMNWA